jgi:hypothetical protein
MCIGPFVCEVPISASFVFSDICSEKNCIHHTSLALESQLHRGAETRVNKFKHITSAINDKSDVPLW